MDARRILTDMRKGIREFLDPVPDLAPRSEGRSDVPPAEALGHDTFWIAGSEAECTRWLENGIHGMGSFTIPAIVSTEPSDAVDAASERNVEEPALVEIDGDACRAAGLMEVSGHADRFAVMGLSGIRPTALGRSQPSSAPGI